MAVVVVVVEEEEKEEEEEDDCDSNTVPASDSPTSPTCATEHEDAIIATLNNASFKPRNDDTVAPGGIAYVIQLGKLSSQYIPLSSQSRSSMSIELRNALPVCV